MLTTLAATMQRRAGLHRVHPCPTHFVRSYQDSGTHWQASEQFHQGRDHHQHCDAQGHRVGPGRGHVHAADLMWHALFCCTLHTEQAHPSSRRYTEEHKKVPTDTAPRSTTGGGYWIVNDRDVPLSAPFTATTVYKAEIQNGAQTAAAQLEKSVGLRCTLPQYHAARHR